jgi:trehalose 6-phosphate synthase
VTPPASRHTVRQIVVASNRGPVTFVRDEEGRPVATRGVGGLVTALTGALQLSGGLWMASAMSEEDRRQAGSGRLQVALGGDAQGYDVRYLAFAPETYERFYNGVSNRLLWYVHHYLWDVARQPSFDAEVERDWESYREVNQAFAEALRREGAAVGRSGPAYLIQDYHLALVPSMLRARRPRARIAHFSHIPFAGPGYFRILPRRMRDELLSGYLGADVVGFHAETWADNFLQCCRAQPGAAVDLRARRVRWKGRMVQVDVNPISIDTEAVQEQARTPRVQLARARLERWLGGRKLVLRVDRAELSKNILRGLVAYGIFLREHPEWHGKLAFLALLNPSRESLPEYQSYVRECLRLARTIRNEFARPGWDPLRMRLKDDYDEALAAYAIYDVLVVNPVFDGMNLVAKEGPLLNQRDGVLILSENAGAFAELGRHALAVNPFDVAGTARAMAAALAMPGKERREHAASLRKTVTASRLDRWVVRQLEALESAPS